jgi:hypothetical protein
MHTYYFKKTYAKSRKTFPPESVECESRAAFLDMLSRWNGIGQGVWAYNEVEASTLLVLP